MVLKENIQIEPYNLDQECKQMILDSLVGNFLFKNLNQKEYQKLIDNMFYCRVKKDEFVFKQHDDASSFFIVKSGEVQVIIND